MSQRTRERATDNRFVAMLDRHVFPRLNDLVLGERVRPLRASVAGGAKGRTLEIGAGTGLNFALYRSSEVVAIELNEGMRLRAVERARELEGSGPRIDVLDANAQSLPFDAASFDSVVSTFVFCSVRKLDVALAEIRRVLRPGGELRLVEHGISEDPLESRLQRRIRPVWQTVFGGCDPTRDIDAALRRAGFDTSGVHRTELPLPYLARPGVSGVARPR